MLRRISMDDGHWRGTLPCCGFRCAKWVRALLLLTGRHETLPGPPLHRRIVRLHGLLRARWRSPVRDARHGGRDRGDRERERAATVARRLCTGATTRVRVGGWLLDAPGQRVGVGRRKVGRPSYGLRVVGHPLGARPERVVATDPGAVGAGPFFGASPTSPVTPGRGGPRRANRAGRHDGPGEKRRSRADRVRLGTGLSEGRTFGQELLAAEPRPKHSDGGGGAPELSARMEAVLPTGGYSRASETQAWTSTSPCLRATSTTSACRDLPRHGSKRRLGNLRSGLHEVCDADDGCLSVADLEEMTALTLTVTLSDVITSCCGTSRVTSRKSTFRRWSIPNGKMKKRPGPLSAIRRPSRETIPRSYSLAILTVADEQAQANE